MSDDMRHSLDDHDEILSVHSEDLVDDAARAELYKHMAFEADRSLKALELKMQRVTDRCQMLQERLHETKKLARKADDDLAHWQRLIGDGSFHCKHWVNNARTSLTKALEGWE